MQKVDIKEFGDELYWYETAYPEQYKELPFLMGEVEPEGQARYNHLCDMIKALRKQYKEHTPFEKSDAKNERIIEKQVEAIQLDKDYKWVMQELGLSRSSYRYSVTHNDEVAALHKQIMRIHNAVRVMVTDTKEGRTFKFKTLREAEKAYGITKGGIGQYLKRAEKNKGLLFHDRFKIERW